MSPLVGTVIRVAAAAVAATYVTPKVVNRFAVPEVEPGDEMRNIMMAAGVHGATAGLIFHILTLAFGGQSATQGVAGGGGAS